MDHIFSLKGRVALITGGAGLLGVKHAEAVLMAGGVPVLADINPRSLADTAKHLQSTYNAEVKSCVMDVTSEESIQKAKSELDADNIEVDILINNAARNPAVGAQGLQTSNRLENLDLRSWNLDLDVGITGAVLCTKVFGTAMAIRGRGVILNISSDLGVIAPDQRLYAEEGRSPWEQNVKPLSYSVVKHALVGLTRYMSTYWGDRGVRCNALSPGGVYNQQNDIFVEKLTKLIPMGRMAKISEYQGAVIFLCSDASSYMNGANLIIDGGRSVW